MLRRFHELREREDGFSLVELLVVIIIIGVLAAIAVPLFMNQERKARETAAKSDVSNLGREIASMWVDEDPSGMTIAQTAGRYLLDGEDIGPSSDGVELLTTALTVWDTTVSGATVARDNWCVGVEVAGGAITNWKYGSDGLVAGICGTV